MKTIFAFCQKTGRNFRQFINKKIKSILSAGQLKLTVSLTIPLIAKVEIQYQTHKKSD